MTEIHDPFDDASQFHLGVTDTDGVGETHVELTNYETGRTLHCDKVHFIPLTETLVCVVGMVAIEHTGFEAVDDIPADSTFLPITVADARQVSVTWDVWDADDTVVLNDSLPTT